MTFIKKFYRIFELGNNSKLEKPNVPENLKKSSKMMEWGKIQSTVLKEIRPSA